jgi:hypothetical protein
MTNAKTKKCNICKREKNLNDFAVCNAFKDGHRHVCRLCVWMKKKGTLTNFVATSSRVGQLYAQMKVNETKDW